RFAGDDSHERFRRALSDDANLPPPRYLLPSARLSAQRGTEGALQASILETLASRGERQAVSLAQIETQYRDGDAHYWAKRFEDALNARVSALRILATVSTHTSFLQYSMRDVLRTFQQLGCQTRLITESRAFEVIGPE